MAVAYNINLKNTVRVVITVKWDKGNECEYIYLDMPEHKIDSKCFSILNNGFYFDVLGTRKYIPSHRIYNVSRLILEDNCENCTCQPLTKERSNA